MKTFDRFEFRISEDDRQRLRALAEQTSRTETGVLRFLIRQAVVPPRGDIEVATMLLLSSGKNDQERRSAA